jgi:glycosyltransferase involved in cell wall biosynthesis
MRNPSLKVQLVGIPHSMGGIRRYADDLSSSLAVRGVHLAESVADLVHAVQPVRHPRGKKFIVTVHDLAPLNNNPSWWFTPVFRGRIERSLKRADAIIANSSQTASEIKQYFGHEEKIRLVNMGISPKFHPSTGDRSSTIGCTRDSIKYGTSITRKVGRRLCPLVEVPEQSAVEYFNNLEYFIDFGMYRGFGYPIVEARACGVTVMTRKTAKIPQEVKELTIQVEDEEDAVEKIMSGVTQPYRPIQFTLEKMALETVAVYEDVLDRE